MILLATDLDNTLIHNYKKAEKSHICVEQMETEMGPKNLSYMTPTAFDLFHQVNQKILIVPITTRSVSQYKRITLFSRETPFAITSNGGKLLVDGVNDPEWFAESEKIINSSITELEKGANLLRLDRYRCFDVKFVDDCFVFTKSENPDETIAQLNAQLNSAKVSIESNGSKIYILPKLLNKGNALKRLKKRLSPTLTFAAGDSPFDVSMLLESDQAFLPSSELLSDCSAVPKMHICPTNGTGEFAEFILNSLNSPLIHQAEYCKNL